MTASPLAARAAENELRKRIEALEQELRSARDQLSRVVAGDDDDEKEQENAFRDKKVSRTSRTSSNYGYPSRPPPQKRGYLFREFLWSRRFAWLFSLIFSRSNDNLASSVHGRQDGMTDP